MSISSATLTADQSPFSRPIPGILVLPWDPYASQSDTLIPYRYEGRSDVRSRAGSPLSALNSSGGEDSEVDLNRMFSRLGRPFKSLARLYCEEEEEEGKKAGDSSSQSEVGSQCSSQSEPAKSTGLLHRSWRHSGNLVLPPESWV